jgi:serine protease Do
LRRFHQPDNPQGSPNSRGRNLMVRQGSGFFISDDGYAVTNSHVVEDTKTAEITTDAGKTYSAKVVGNDSRTDIALIKVEGTGFPFVKFAEASPRVGDVVLAIGNPFGLGGTVAAGIVSARGRDIGDGPYEDFIQIDASVNKGSSGALPPLPAPIRRAYLLAARLPQKRSSTDGSTRRLRQSPASRVRAFGAPEHDP